MSRNQTALTRRAVLGALAGGVGTAVADPARAQEATPTGGGGETHTVDMTDELVFDPESVTIAPGDTVVWENVGSVGHSVTAYDTEIPEEAAYFASGGFDSEQAARNAYSAGDPDSGDIAGGESYEHTFPVEGSYNYFCIPHETVGMLGSIEVVPGGGGGDGGSEPAVPDVPDAAKSIGVAAAATFASVLGLTYLFVKYGGDYDVSEDAGGD